VLIITHSVDVSKNVEPAGASAAHQLRSFHGAFGFSQIECLNIFRLLTMRLSNHLFQSILNEHGPQIIYQYRVHFYE
jgi:hypothetical protein